MKEWTRDTAVGLARLPPPQPFLLHPTGGIRYLALSLVFNITTTKMISRFFRLKPRITVRQNRYRVVAVVCFDGCSRLDRVGTTAKCPGRYN